MSQRRVFAVATMLMPFAVTFAGIEPPLVEWEKLYGGEGDEEGHSVQQTTDGGYILVGDTASHNPGGNDSDVYLVKIDAEGNETWSRTFGGDQEDTGQSVLQASDGGYVVAGTTWSFGAGLSDVYLIKTDPAGDEQWSKTFGGDDRDWCTSVRQTNDGGYVLAGTTRSFGDGLGDLYVIKTDTDGNTEWARVFGNNNIGEGHSAHETSDGGYLVAGTSGPAIHVIKTDRNGNQEWTWSWSWQCPVGGCFPDKVEALWVEETSDGGAVIVVCISATIDANGLLISSELIKINASGDTAWSTSLPCDDCAVFGRSVQETIDGGYIVAGEGGEFLGDDSLAMRRYLLKTDANGTAQWMQLLGGCIVMNSGGIIQQTRDGGFVVVGTTGHGPGCADNNAGLLKLSPEPVRFTRGRTEPDATPCVADAVCVLSYLFDIGDGPCEGEMAQCLDAADANDDGSVNVADGVYILQYLFVNGPTLSPPFFTCGYDETHDGLRCLHFEGCE